ANPERPRSSKAQDIVCMMARNRTGSKVPGCWRRSPREHRLISRVLPLKRSQRSCMEKRKVIIRKVNGEILKGYVEESLDPVNGKENSITITSLTEEVIRVPKPEIK